MHARSLRKTTLKRGVALSLSLARAHSHDCAAIGLCLIPTRMLPSCVCLRTGGRERAGARAGRAGRAGRARDLAAPPPPPPPHRASRLAYFDCDVRLVRLSHIYTRHLRSHLRSAVLHAAAPARARCTQITRLHHPPTPVSTPAPAQLPLATPRAEVSQCISFPPRRTRERSAARSRI